MRVRVLASLAVILLASPAAASAAFPHVVEAGESLSSVAASDGVSVEALAAANGLSPETPLIAGSTLQIPEQGEASPTSEGETSQAVQGEGETSQAGQSEGGEPTSSERGGSYVVQPGDTLSAIAARSGMSVEALAAANGLEPNGTLLAGAILNVAGGGGSEAAAREGGQVEAVNAPPYPTEESVSPAEVGAVAEEHGVPASFAEAIAEQESGFNNALTSSADARGEMQIIPETWSFINQELAGSSLEPASAASNVRGGVLYLRWLLGETGGDPGLAAAGYYQGIESVRQEGELPETEEYVSSVLALKSRFAGE